jgi:hypothetical protein
VSDPEWTRAPERLRREGLRVLSQRLFGITLSSDAAENLLLQSGSIGAAIDTIANPKARTRFDPLPQERPEETQRNEAGSTGAAETHDKIEKPHAGLTPVPAAGRTKSRGLRMRVGSLVTVLSLLIVDEVWIDLSTPGYAIQFDLLRLTMAAAIAILTVLGSRRWQLAGSVLLLLTALGLALLTYEGRLTFAGANWANWHSSTVIAAAGSWLAWLGCRSDD